MAGGDAIDVEVAYALSAHQYVVSVRVAAGTQVADAIRQSGILQEFPEIDLATAKLGIFSRRVDAHDVVSDGDRIEIYRPLLVDPKTVRRLRAQVRKQRIPG